MEKKIIVKQVADELLSSAVASAIEKVNRTQAEIDSWEEKIIKWGEEYGLEKNLFINFFEIEFPENTLGHLYADFLLNARPVTLNQSVGAPVKLKSMRCYLYLGLSNESPTVRYKPAYSVRFQIMLENEAQASEDFSQEIIYDRDVVETTMNWVSDDVKPKKGFGFYGVYYPFHELGLALIFEDDSIRNGVISAIAKTLKEIKKRFRNSPELKFINEEQLRAARTETPRVIRTASSMNEDNNN